MTKRASRLSVIIPFFNEPNIVRTYKKLCMELARHPQPFQLVFVSDGSTELSITKLQAAIKNDEKTMLIAYPQNRGRGYAVQHGFRKAIGDYILYIDSDLDIHEKHIQLVVKALETYDVVIGSKVHPQSNVHTRLSRKVASPLLNALVRIGLGTNVKDHHVGLKGFRRKVVELILPKITQERWMFDAEIIKLVKDNGFTIGEIPISMTYGTGPLKLSYTRYFADIIIFIIAFRMKRLFEYFTKSQ